MPKPQTPAPQKTEAEDVAMFKELAKPASIVERLDRIAETLNASYGDRR